VTIAPSTRKALLASYLRPLALCERWLTPEGVAKTLDEEIGRLDDDEWNRKYHDAIQIGSPADYRNRLVETDAGSVLCGLRFYNGDRDTPFVELVARTSEDVSWEDGARAAMHAYEVFMPQRASFMRVGASPPETGPGWSTTPDQRFIVGEAGAMRRSPKGQWDDRLSLAPVEVDEAKALMDEAYARFAERQPELAPRVPPATREQLEQCDTDGLLRTWHIDDECAGVLGVVPQTFLGLEATLVMEEFATPSWAGRGTASCAQRALARELDDGALVVGTIDDRNRASLKTAERAGREVVASWWFLTPED
jgi:hypothetical protein